MLIRNYAGWLVHDMGPHYHPTTGRFYALKWGVRMGHNTQEGIIRMIDRKLADERERSR